MMSLAAVPASAVAARVYETPCVQSSGSLLGTELHRFPYPSSTDLGYGCSLLLKITTAPLLSGTRARKFSFDHR